MLELPAFQEWIDQAILNNVKPLLTKYGNIGSIGLFIHSKYGNHH
jgi:hypothetical protein